MGVKWGKTTAYTDGSKAFPVGALPQGNVKVKITGLTANTLYYFRLYGTWSGSSWSDLGSGKFTTYSGGVPIVEPNVAAKRGVVSIISLKNNLLEFSTEQGGDYSIAITTPSGKVAYQGNNTATTGVVRHDIAHSTLSSGLYIVNITLGSTRLVQSSLVR